jgi:eukaryotic-like serine/threonine-protein kinase
LMKVSVNGGAPIAVCETPIPFGASWPSDDTILFSQGVGGIWQVPAAGGKPEQLVKLEANERAHGPQLLPDGRTLLYTVSSRGESWDEARIVARPLDGGETRTLVRGGSDARYLSTGHLIHARGANLMAVPFNLSRLETTGDPVTLVNDLARSLADTTGAAHFSLSDDGTLAYVSASSSGLNLAARFVWVDRMGRETPISVLPRVYLAPTISPDGTRVAYQTTQDGNNDVWTYEFRRGISERVTTEPGAETDAVWSPDSRRIAYRAEGQEGGPGIFVKASDGSGSAERLTSGRHVPSSWSRDGTRLLYADFGNDVITSAGPADLAMVTLMGDRRSETLLTTPVRESNVHFSPDGRWIAYEATETGERAIFVRPFPDVSAARWRISSAGGSSAVWARDGQTLFYRSGQAIMAVAIRGATPAEWGAPERLFEGTYFFIEGPEMFDVAADGRFLLLKVGDDQRKTTPDTIVVVQNWIEELTRRVPAK